MQGDDRKIVISGPTATATKTLNTQLIQFGLYTYSKLGKDYAAEANLDASPNSDGEEVGEGSDEQANVVQENRNVSQSHSMAFYV